MGIGEMIGGLVELGLVGGGFAFLLYFTVAKCITQLDNISVNLLAVSNTLTKIDKRMDEMENRLTKLEGKGDRYE